MSAKATMGPEELARASSEVMWADDIAAQRLGIGLDEVGPGRATLSFTIRPEMANGHGNCHGGFIFALADTAFAYACNSYGDVAVAQHCVITYVNPASTGDRLTAVAREVSRRGRSGIYDISVTNQDGVQVAEFRGHSRAIKGKHLVPPGRVPGEAP
jgi:acyl-CoA thioesterase